MRRPSRTLSATTGIAAAFATIAVSLTTSPAADAGAAHVAAGVPSLAGSAVLARSAVGDDPKNQPGKGPLKLRLTNLPDGKILVHWKGKGPRKNFKPWKIVTSTSRKMDTDRKVYHAKGKKRSKVVPHAPSVTPASGDYTFVKVYAKRKHHLKGGSSPAKWIQAPVTATPSGSDRLTIGTFNVRDADISAGTPDWGTWNKRRPEVARTISSSGAGIVNLQEASGSMGTGTVAQAQQIAADTGLTLVNASPYSGAVIGKQGARILYNKGLYSVVASGQQPLPSGYWVAWAEFQENSTGRRFFDVSMHLQKGNTATEERARVGEADAVITLARQLATRDGRREVFVAGDSNSTIYSKPKGLVHREFIGNGFYDAFATTQISGQAYPTTNDFQFPVKMGPFRRDLIMSFNGPQGSFWYHNLAYASQSQIASDHFMQVAQLPLG